MDIFSKSDPCVKVTELFPANKKHKLGKTETIKNNLNPVFGKAVIADYYFEIE